MHLPEGAAGARHLGQTRKPRCRAAAARSLRQCPPLDPPTHLAPARPAPAAPANARHDHAALLGASTIQQPLSELLLPLLQDHQRLPPNSAQGGSYSCSLWPPLSSGFTPGRRSGRRGRVRACDWSEGGDELCDTRRLRDAPQEVCGGRPVQRSSPRARTVSSSPARRTTAWCPPPPARQSAMHDAAAPRRVASGWPRPREWTTNIPPVPRNLSRFFLYYRA